MKRIMACVLTGILTLGCGTTVFGEEKLPARMQINGTEVQQPLYENKDHAQMVPVREVSDLLGYTVTWDARTRSVVVSDGTTSLAFAPDTDAYTIGDQTKQIGAAPELKDGVLYAPSRIFSLYFPVALQYNGPGNIVATDLKGQDVEKVTGSVVDGTMYTLIVRLEDGTLRIFTKENADVNLSQGLLIDSTVTVYYRSTDPKTAIKLVQQEENLEVIQPEATNGGGQAVGDSAVETEAVPQTQTNDGGALQG